MSTGPLYANVVTTIQRPTKALSELSVKVKERNELLIVIGDKKTPDDFLLTDGTFLSAEDQSQLSYNLVSKLPWNSYTRKMLGYLEAKEQGCKFIRETDDDNYVLDTFFMEFPETMLVRVPATDGTWINPYLYFSSEYIWPRGYPIELIDSNRNVFENEELQTVNQTVSKIGVLQGLADGAPDVDAVYRLILSNSGDFKFEFQTPLLIPQGQFAPFNSQVTTWNIDLLPLMYLPQTCTFRMTDIWRSYIATHLMQLNGYELVFLSACAFQERNAHVLLRDFSDEVPGYLGNSILVEELQGVSLLGGMNNLGKDMLKLYQHLTAKGFFQIQELEGLEAWLLDCTSE